MGTTDRIVRVILALIVAALYFTNVITGTLGTILLIVAAVIFMTAIINFCPLYAIFKLSTRKEVK